MNSPIKLPPLPEPRIVSYQVDSILLYTELRTYDDADMRAYAEQAVREALAAQREWMPIETAPKRLSKSVGANNYGPRIIGYSKGREPYACRWWWRDGEEHISNFILDGGMVAYPQFWQPLPAPPKENNHGDTP